MPRRITKKPSVTVDPEETTDTQSPKTGKATSTLKRKASEETTETQRKVSKRAPKKNKKVAKKAEEEEEEEEQEQHDCEKQVSSNDREGQHAEKAAPVEAAGSDESRLEAWTKKLGVPSLKV
jgi:hypothetical protein